MKKTIIIVFIFFLTLSILAQDKKEASAVKMQYLTKAELAEFNGKNGKPAYVAIEGIIYDITNVGPWKNGEHHGNTAGQDVTEAIKTKSPHGLSVLKKLKITGYLIEMKISIKDLSQYDGKDGKRAFVAVDGIIYDVTGIEPWKSGEHKGYKAGQDITEFIKTDSPHGVKVLEKRKIVGIIIK